jgi:K+ transporter
MYEKLVILSVLTTYAPEAADSERIEIEKPGHGVWRITARYRFMESPDMT